MYGTREFRFSYLDKNGELQYLHTRNIWIAQKIVAERGGSDCKRAPLPKNKPLTTGTCQICGREIGTTTGKIAHHGYTRPGTGWQTASCFGAKWRPYEVACDALPPCIDMMERWVEQLEAANDSDMANPPDTISYTVKGLMRHNPSKTYTVERPANFDPKAEPDRYVYPRCEYTSRFHAQIAQRKGFISASKSDIKILKQRLADWKEPK